MKKILFFIFLGFVLLNSKVFSMEKKQSTVQQNLKTELSKIDWVKIAAASGGCAWFAIAACTNYHAIKDKTDNFLIYPMILMYYHLSRDIGEFGPLDKFWIKLSELLGYDRKDVNLGLIRIGSAFLASGLGFYIFKKLKDRKPPRTKDCLTDVSNQSSVEHFSKT